MKINEAIRTLMKDLGVRQIDMAVAIGKSKATDIGARLSIKNLSFDKAKEMLDVLDYEIVIRPKSGDGEVIIID